MARSKPQLTHAKRAREQARLEKRARKQAKKDARKHDGTQPVHSAADAHDGADALQPGQG